MEIYALIFLELVGDYSSDCKCLLIAPALLTSMLIEGVYFAISHASSSVTAHP